jgi:Taurine catabolism dioxygenase TauD, TfdA family
MLVEPLRHLDLRTGIAPAPMGARIVDACQRTRLVVVHADPEQGCHREFWDEALAAHAQRAAVDEDASTGQANGGLWSDVSFDPARQNTFRHSKGPQPLHTDGAYITDPPPIVFMVCKQSAPSGGATLFLDGQQLDEALAREQPELRERLMAEPVLFGKGASEVESPILKQDGSIRLRWNYYALSARASTAAWQVAEAFRAFLEQMVQQRRLTPVRLQPGDAVFFHDGEVLHGRDGFIAREAGDRHLWKGGLSLR